MQGLQVGHLVRLRKNFDGSKSGTCAYVYSTAVDNEFPDNNAAFLITRQGIDLSRMNVRRQNEFLDFITDSEFRYAYDGELKLKRDWTDGIFEDAFIKCNA